ncbi:hypothetical protein BG011_008700 [Mortierella polycephala]|uniref:Major facilitator superfamily (MFS) profile domain-containing protein n=1 Tax=Mortierella polycephala TaxID=41804 RepID=A0A9P6PNI2_9FUNG|nr:hypothetical protein BG011_008700 [Mortierella polycephala]
MTDNKGLDSQIPRECAIEKLDYDYEKASIDPAADLDPIAVAKLRRKIDIRLIPLISVLYLCSFLDRVNIGNAKVAGLEEDIHLTPTEYNWSLSIFFIGYVLFEIPSNVLLKKIGPRKWITIVMLVWGVIMMSMAAVTNAAGLLASRFFLGLAESGLFPGAVYLISLWYTRGEQALRNGLFFSTATMAGAFGGVLAYGIAQMDGIQGLHGWQWIFILEGLPTVLLTLVTYFFLEDFPETARFLSEDEKSLAVMRLKIDAGPATETEFSWKQFNSVFTDWKVYMHMITYILSASPLYSLSLFFPSIVQGFKFNRYVSLTVTATGVFSSVPSMLSWFTTNIGGHTKRGVATAAIISFGNIGGALGGQFYSSDDIAHGFVRGHTICAVMMAVSGVLTLVMKYLLIRENKRRDNLTPEEFAREAEGEDLCDNHPGFRYYS